MVLSHRWCDIPYLSDRVADGGVQPTEPRLVVWEILLIVVVILTGILAECPLISHKGVAAVDCSGALFPQCTWISHLVHSLVQLLYMVTPVGAMDGPGNHLLDGIVRFAGRRKMQRLKTMIVWNQQWMNEVRRQPIANI